MTPYTVPRDGERLDLICWRYYGRLSGRVVEQVLAANPGLAARDPARLPAGLPLVMPPLPQQRAPGPRAF